MLTCVFHEEFQLTWGSRYRGSIIRARGEATIVLVGREREYRRLLERLNTSTLAPGAVRFVQLDGPLGIGKSTLLARVLPAITARTLVVRGQRHDVDTGAALSAVRGLVEELLAAPLEQLSEQTSPSALARQCAAALSQAPTVIAVDDAPWLDESSQELLAELLLTPVTSPLILLVVHRTEAEPSRLISAARQRGALHEQLTLPGIPEEQLEQLVADLWPQQRRAVVDVAQGNPLFARTVAAGFRRHPAARRVEEVLRLEQGSQSAVLSAALADDVASLSAPGRTVLEALAMVGQAVDDRIVREVSGVDEEEYRAATQELTDRGLLSFGPRSKVHPVVRFSVYQGIDLDRRLAAHRRAAELAGDETLIRAEHLAHASADLGEREVEVLIDAARVAVVSEPHTVLRWLTQISPALRRPASETLLARAEMLCGEHERAVTRLRGLLAVSETPEARILLANVLRIQGELHEARTVLARAAESGSGVTPDLLRELIDVVGQMDGSVPSDLIDQLQAYPGAENHVTGTIYRVMGQLSSGQVPRAREAFAEAAPWLLNADADALRPLLHSVACAVWCAYMLEEFAMGADLAERGLTVARRFGQADVLASLGVGLSFIQVQLAHLPDADETAFQAIRDAEHYGSDEVEAMARTALLMSAQAQAHADPELLQQRYEELQQAVVPRFGWWRRAVLTTLTRVSALLGEPVPRSELLGEPRDVMAPLRYADGALASAVQGNMGLAASLLDEAEALAAQHGSRGQGAMIKIARAEMLTRQGQFGVARQLLNDARVVVQELGMALQLGRVHGSLARLEAAQARAEDPLNALTRREREIAEQIAAGRTSREIADHFTLSPRTVEHHTANIMRKLNLSSRMGIVALLRGS